MPRPHRTSEELRLYVNLREITPPVNTMFHELIDYIEVLESRIAALEGGAQNKPFILPVREGQAGSRPPI